MKKSNLIKVTLILLISLMAILFSTNVNAADDTSGFDDITDTLTATKNTTNNTANNATAGTNSTNTINNTNSTNNVNNTNNTNNTSVYNNTSLPKTGIEDSIPVAMLVVVFGISAVYAYKKIKEYKNI